MKLPFIKEPESTGKYSGVSKHYNIIFTDELGQRNASNEILNKKSMCFKKYMAWQLCLSRSWRKLVALNNYRWFLTQQNHQSSYKETNNSFKEAPIPPKLDHHLEF